MVIDILFVGWLYFAGYNFVGQNLTAGYAMAYFFALTNLDYNRVILIINTDNVITYCQNNIGLQVQCNYNERISSFSFITNTKDYQTKGAIQ